MNSLYDSNDLMNSSNRQDFLRLPPPINSSFAFGSSDTSPDPFTHSINYSSNSKIKFILNFFKISYQSKIKFLTVILVQMTILLEYLIPMILASIQLNLTIMEIQILPSRICTRMQEII